MRLFAVLFILAALVLIPFLVWGDRFMAAFEGESARIWLETHGRTWGWLAGLGLLVADLVLPVPATSVISALGYVYGAAAGGLLGTAGSFAAGTLSYELCRRGGPRLALWLLGPRDLERAGRVFSTSTGGWLVALSRWLPLLPEMSSCMAGLTSMPRPRYYLALGSGCLPMGLTFAVIGASGTARPGLALTLSALVPAALSFASAWWLKRR